ncbi:hypothetical protein EV368DRAFT_66846 [Lentinula lateritia]|nr:hypothetical protein EV368DRAFT_66846 [Lentinula lateritia]
MRSIILGCHQMSNSVLQGLYPEFAFCGWSESQLDACNECLRTWRTVADCSGYVPTHIVKLIEDSLPKPLEYLPSDYASGPHIKVLLIYQRHDIGSRGLPLDRNGLQVSFRLFRGGCGIVTDVAFLLACMINGLDQDGEHPGLATLSYCTSADYCIGYMIFASVSDSWFDRARTTPMFEVQVGPTDTFVATWPLYDDCLSTEALIRVTMNDIDLREEMFDASSAYFTFLLVTIIGDCSAKCGWVLIHCLLMYGCNCTAAVEIKSQSVDMRRVSLLDYLVPRDPVCREPLGKVSHGKRTTPLAKRPVVLSKLRSDLRYGLCSDDEFEIGREFEPVGLNALHRLRAFDHEITYGPSLGMTRMFRWNRANLLGLHPPMERTPAGYEQPCLNNYVVLCRNATAAFDPSMFYSAISRNFLTSECGICSSSGTFQSLVTFSTPYSAFTILADFFVVDDLGEYNTVIGLQIWRSCERLSCTEFPLALPRIQSTICSPLPPLLSHVPLGPGPSTRCTVQAALTDGLVTTVMESSVAASQSGHLETIASPSSESLLHASLLRKSVTGIRCSVFVEDMVLFSRTGSLMFGHLGLLSYTIFLLGNVSMSETAMTIAVLLQLSKSVDLPMEKLKLMLESNVHVASHTLSGSMELFLHPAGSGLCRLPALLRYTKKKVNNEAQEKRKMHGKGKSLKRYLRKQRKNVIDPAAVAIRAKIEKQKAVRKAEIHKAKYGDEPQEKSSALDRFKRDEGLEDKDEDEILRRAQERIQRVRERKAAEAARKEAEEKAARAAAARRQAVQEARERALRAQQQEEAVTERRRVLAAAATARSRRGTSPSEVSASPRRPVVEISKVRSKDKGKAKAQPVGEDPDDGDDGDNDNDEDKRAPCKQCRSKKISCQMQAGKRSSIICKPCHDAKVRCSYSTRPFTVKREGGSNPTGERLAVLESQMAQLLADNRQLREGQQDKGKRP